MQIRKKYFIFCIALIASVCVHAQQRIDKILFVQPDNAHGVTGFTDVESKCKNTSSDVVFDRNLKEKRGNPIIDRLKQQGSFIWISKTVEKAGQTIIVKYSWDERDRNNFSSVEKKQIGVYKGYIVNNKVTEDFKKWFDKSINNYINIYVNKQTKLSPLAISENISDKENNLDDIHYDVAKCALNSAYEKYYVVVTDDKEAKNSLSCIRREAPIDKKTNSMNLKIKLLGEPMPDQTVKYNELEKTKIKGLVPQVPKF